MERQTSDIMTKFHVTGTRAVIHAAVHADHGGFSSPIERTDRILAALAKADLIIVPKPTGNSEAVRKAVKTGDWSAISEKDLLAWREAPIEGLNIVLDEEGKREVMAAAASLEARDPRVVRFSERPHPEADPDEEPEAEKETGGSAHGRHPTSRSATGAGSRSPVATTRRTPTPTTTISGHMPSSPNAQLGASSASSSAGTRKTASPSCRGPG